MDTTAAGPGGSSADSAETSGGATRNGDACDGTTDCGAGFECVADPTGVGTVCAAACVPFDGTDDCGDGWFCLGQTATTGLCAPPTDAGSDEEETCNPSLHACAEDRLCQPAGGGTICVTMCRFAMGDADCPPMRTCIDAYDLDELGGCAPP